MKKKKINTKNFRVRAGEKVNLKKWPTRVKACYQSKGQYQEILREHIRKLSAQQNLLCVYNHYSLLVLFRQWTPPAKIAPSRMCCPA